MANIDEIIPVLRVLFADLTQDECIRAINNAVPSVIVHSNGGDLRAKLHLIEDNLVGASGIVDGSSGLGAIAAGRAAKRISTALEQSKRLRKSLY